MRLFTSYGEKFQKADDFRNEQLKDKENDLETIKKQLGSEVRLVNVYRVKLAAVEMEWDTACMIYNSNEATSKC